MATQTSYPQPSLAEQLVASTVLGLRQLEQVLGYEFEETIDTIEKLHDLDTRELTEEQRLELDVERGNHMSDLAEEAYRGEVS